MLGEPRTRELVELRSGLEIQAMELASTRVTDEALNRMRHNLETMSRNLDNYSAFVEADALFHREIADCAGNAVLGELLQSIRSLLRIWVDRALADEDHAEARSRSTPILQALESGNPATAAEAMRSHMVTASRRLLAGFDTSGKSEAPPRVIRRTPNPPAVWQVFWVGNPYDRLLLHPLPAALERAVRLPLSTVRSPTFFAPVGASYLGKFHNVRLG
ncbi:FadR/GntR family transcriptional regulator [Paenarthrobacter ureafaciens]|uniref:FadR/GntR family transcriptional regulator n=1 Tax=Paenarthrobacter ureafaciens TaxID=37931 RepID=UPI00308415F5